MSDRDEDLHFLLALARDRSVEGRKHLVATIGDLFARRESVLSQRERALMTDILNKLLHDFEMTVRRQLSERLAEEAHASRQLIITLANDEIEVARPILLKSTVLHDHELIEIIQHRSTQHQLAIAMRDVVSERVSDALIQAGDVDVITALLENFGAAISQDTMQYLVEEAKRVDSYQEPIINRPDLTPELAKRLYWWVSAALRRHILDNFEIDPTRLDDMLEAVGRSIEGECDRIAGSVTLPAVVLARRLAAAKEINPQLMIQTLRQGEIPLFEALFAQFTGLRPPRLQRIIYDPGGEGLAVACRAAGVAKQDFASLFLLSRKGRPGDKTVDPRELSRVLSFFDRIKLRAAKAVVKTWQRDPNYLNAIERIEENLGDAAAS